MRKVKAPSVPSVKTSTLRFTVDAALLRELGERLVGQPHIALAELIKNAYDADARHVEVTVATDYLSVEDDGHGMSADDFRDFWMRIGTPHKQAQARSRKLKRPLTGSKGVGRLAVQFLARQLEISTTSETEKKELTATVDWDEAVTAHELTSATVATKLYPTSGRYLTNSRHGTRIVMRSLNDVWTPDTLKSLAQEIWLLQPPFGAQDRDDPRSFQISLTSPDPTIKKAFDERLTAHLNLWTARVRGKLLPRDASDAAGSRRFECIVQFRHAGASRTEFVIPKCVLDDVTYDVRIFSLHGRQPLNIPVDEAREYLANYGNVHIYDAGFHLPYYGPQVDWLNIERDHSHRRSASDFLPEEYHVVQGLNNLPTATRIYGIVNIDTAHERRAAEKARRSVSRCLQIQVTRDRLVDNDGYRQLITIVRTALDLYAMKETSRRLAALQDDFTYQVRTRESLEDALKLLEANKSLIPRELYEGLRSTIEAAADRIRTERDVASAEVGLLASLATAGINALSLDHEVNRELNFLNSMVRQLRGIEISDQRISQVIVGLANDLDHWIDRVRQTRAVFSPLLTEEDRKIRTRPMGSSVIAAVIDQVASFTRGIQISYHRVDPGLRLPSGTMAEWSTVLQNVFINAANALLDTPNPTIDVSSKHDGGRRALLVQDNGSGIDLKTSEALFKPFARMSTISAERRALGLGGLGFGLSIVRIIATSRNATATFVKPEPGYSTAFELAWEER